MKQKFQSIETQIKDHIETINKIHIQIISRVMEAK